MSEMGDLIVKLGESVHALMAERDRYKTALEFVARRATYGTEIRCVAREALEKPQKETQANG